MANTKSAKKMVRKIATRTAVNKSRKTRMKSAVRAAEEAFATGDKAKAGEALKKIEPALMKAAQNGVIDKRTAARKVSRMTKRLRTISA